MARSSRPSLFVEGDARREGDLGERPVAVVVVEQVRVRVVGHEEVRPAVVVVVAPHDAQAPVALVVQIARAHGHVGEGPVTVVVEEHVARAGEAARTAHDGKAVVEAVLLRSRPRGGLQVEVDIAGHVKIEAAVVVVIGEGRARRPAAGGDAGRIGDVGERPVTLVAQQHVAAEEGQVDVGPAVVVVVADRDALSPPAAGDAGGDGHVGERPVAVVPVERAARALAVRESRQRRSVGEEQVEPAVAVVIEEGDARARGFEDVGARVLAAVGGPESEARGGGTVHEDDRRRGESAGQAEQRQRRDTNPEGNHWTPPGVYHAWSRTSIARRNAAHAAPGCRWGCRRRNRCWGSGW